MYSFISYSMTDFAHGTIAQSPLHTGRIYNQSSTGRQPCRASLSRWDTWRPAVAPTIPCTYTPKVETREPRDYTWTVYMYRYSRCTVRLDANHWNQPSIAIPYIRATVLHEADDQTRKSIQGTFDEWPKIIKCRAMLYMWIVPEIKTHGNLKLLIQ